jgi:hypothetical protein
MFVRSKRTADMTKHIYGSLGKGLKMFFGISQQKLKRRTLMIMGNDAPRDPPKPLDAIDVRVIGRRIDQIQRFCQN